VARVRIHPDVLASLKEQRQWIAEHRNDGWAERLRQDLDEALGTLAGFPRIGEAASTGERKAAGGKALRRLPLRRTPFVLWYALEEPADEVWVLRFFHSRQSRSPGGRRRRRGAP
jgi:plasmid stabilization system protein ParE